MGIRQAKLNDVVPDRILYVAWCDRGNARIKTATILDYPKFKGTIPVARAIVQYEDLMTGHLKTREEFLYLRDAGIVEPNHKHRTFLTRREAQAHIREYVKQYAKEELEVRKSIRGSVDRILR